MNRTATFPFTRSPDSFWLICPAGEAGMTVRPYVSQWGETGELLCHAGGVLMGRLLSRHADPADVLTIALLPRLDRMRPYDWPSADDFLHALLRILRQVPTAMLSCERDTDQAGIDHLASYGEVEQALQLLMRYCRDDGDVCPNFIYPRPALA
ncbi:hypothetical protein [Massilia sp. CCM 8734]|uniref:hypothetical protein n=1 Tax=Massilia sp. CCM 8734 TaxID=2609283 RepID=UPI0014205B5C|nr:hypothetical protein [Massilia sp. CCM 8734]NHZ96422.1 hypothetical protein [Massilia sp. CCM 8734]